MSAYISWPDGQLYFHVITSEEHELPVLVTEHPVERGVNVVDHVRPQVERVTLEGLITQTPLGLEQRAIFDGIGTINGPLDSQIYVLPSIGSVKLDVPVYTPPLAPTPGAVTAALSRVASAAFNFITGQDNGTTAQVLTGPSSTKTQTNNVSIQGFDKDFDFVADTMATLRNLRETGTVLSVITPSHTYDSMILEGVSMKRDAGIGDGARFTLDLRQLRVVESKLVAAPVPTETRGTTKTSAGSQNGNTPSSPTQKKSLLKAILG